MKSRILTVIFSILYIVGVGTLSYSYADQARWVKAVNAVREHGSEWIGGNQRVYTINMRHKTKNLTATYNFNQNNAHLNLTIERATKINDTTVKLAMVILTDINQDFIPDIVTMTDQVIRDGRIVHSYTVPSFLTPPGTEVTWNSWEKGLYEEIGRRKNGG